MSYARFGWEGSNVYVFLSCTGQLECCGCCLRRQNGRPAQSRFSTTDGMLAHLTQHRAAGHKVPQSCVEELELDREENDKWMAAEASA